LIPALNDGFQMGRRETGGPLHFRTIKKLSFSRDSRRVNKWITTKMADFSRFRRI
jgi:hypothetical protein